MSDINRERLEGFKADARKAVDMAYQAGMNDAMEFVKGERAELMLALEGAIGALEDNGGGEWPRTIRAKQAFADAKGEPK